MAEFDLGAPNHFVARRLIDLIRSYDPSAGAGADGEHVYADFYLSHEEAAAVVRHLVLQFNEPVRQHLARELAEAAARPILMTMEHGVGRYRAMHRRAQAAERRAIRAEKRERHLRARLRGLQVATRLLEQAARTDKPVAYVRNERGRIDGFRP